MPTWLRTLIRLTPIVAGVSALSIGGLVVVRQLVPLETLRASNDSVGNYLQTVGGIYAVLLAFVVFVVWGQFNEAREYVEREATALVDLHRTASGLPTATRIEIQKELREYVDAVLSDEWRAMACGDELTIERIGALLDQVWLAIHRCQPATECQHTIYGEVLSRFNDLSDMRTSRLTSARAKMPLAMRMLLFIGAVIIIGSMWLLGVERLWIHALVTAALAGSVAHILYLIVDLDEAFAGLIQVSQAPFIRARRTFERATHSMDAAA